jgi:hypothetical protein
MPQDHGTAFEPAFRQSVDEFSEASEIAERISRLQRTNLAAILPRKRGSAPVDLIQLHTISFLARSGCAILWRRCRQTSQRGGLGLVRNVRSGHIFFATRSDLGRSNKMRGF